jgi:hypothetical protein
VVNGVAGGGGDFDACGAHGRREEAGAFRREGEKRRCG